MRALEGYWIDFLQRLAICFCGVLHVAIVSAQRMITSQRPGSWLESTAFTLLGLDLGCSSWREYSHLDCFGDADCAHV